MRRLVVNWRYVPEAVALRYFRWRFRRLGMTVTKADRWDGSGTISGAYPDGSPFTVHVSNGERFAAFHARQKITR